MIAVMFEVQPRPGCEATYFETAAQLRPALEKIEGFISVERFQSLSRSGVFLSLSYWEDEQAVLRWRNQGEHRSSQQAGRDQVFANYSIRVANVVRDYGLHPRDQAPADSKQALT
jgi:heme-degrading monooxygenase HmoA